MSGGAPEVTFVIVNYNGARALELTIPSVLQQQGTRTVDVLLVDNASTDNSVELVRTKFPAVKILSTGVNRGPNVARNLGLRSSRTSLVLVMDNDLVLAPDYAQRLAALLEETPRAAAASGKILFYGGQNVVQYNGIDIHFAGEIRKRDLAASGRAQVTSVSAGAAMFRREWVERVGWFDEDLFFGWEDGDLTFRLSLAGHGCWVDSDALAYHQSAHRGGKWVRLQTRNRWWFMRTHYSRRTFWLCLPAFLILQFCAALFLMVRGQVAEFARGTWQGWRHGAMVRRKHKHVQSLRRVADRNLLCGDRLTLPGDLERTAWGRIATALVSGLFHLYWLVIRPLLPRTPKG